MCGPNNTDLVRSLGADCVVDYSSEDYSRLERRFDVILDNVMNRSPKESARVLAPGGVLIPNSIGTKGRFLGTLPRIARAALMGRGATNVQFVTCVVNQENLSDLAALLEEGSVKPILDSVYPLAQAGQAVAGMLGHHAAGNVVIEM